MNDDIRTTAEEVFRLDSIVRHDSDGGAVKASHRLQDMGPDALPLLAAALLREQAKVAAWKQLAQARYRHMQDFDADHDDTRDAVTALRALGISLEAP